MKRRYFSTIHLNAALVALSVLVQSCAKDKDNSDPIGTPTNSKPKIEIISPTGNVSVGKNNNVALQIKYTDQVEMLSTTIVMGAEAINFAPYYSETRQLNGLKDQIAEDVTFTQVNLLGKHRVTVTANNDLGKQEFIEGEFILVDDIDPVITIIEFYSDLWINPGTPESKYNFEISENYMLKKVTWEIVKTDAAGNIQSQLFVQTKDFLSLTTSFVYNEVFDPMYDAYPGDYYKGIVTAEDIAGNIKVVSTAVKQFY